VTAAALTAAFALASPVVASAAGAGPRLAPAYAANSAIQHYHYRYGPLSIGPGHNQIQLGPYVRKPTIPGYVIGIRPNLIRTDGSVPPVDEIHLHHGVWVNLSRRDATSNLPERFFASGEEKTYLTLPSGYGYPLKPSDNWLINYMIHNLTPNPETVYITYDIDFVPANSPLGRRMKAVRPIWMDVRNGYAYPVFNALRANGHNGRFTYPNDAVAPYGSGPPLNEWKVDRPGTLVMTMGHLHPGGLYDDLEVVRAGASVAGAGARRPVAGAVPHSVRLFRSVAHYWDPHGPVSWDLSMSRAPNNWRVRVKPGDVLRVSTTYTTQNASWYDDMGIMVLYMADDRSGVDPFRRAVPQSGPITHGQLADATHFGGLPQSLPDPAALAPQTVANNIVNIRDFSFTPGDQALSSGLNDPPTIAQGQQLTFVNDDASSQILHSITACLQPCTRSTGASYPLADGPVDFDSGNLGTGPPGLTAASNQTSWQTPSNLPPGTYTFFCRIHPFMRGSFRVVPG
jgi:plastocyanin